MKNNGFKGYGLIAVIVAAVLALISLLAVKLAG